MELRARADVPVDQTWDLSLIYADEGLMWEDVERTRAAVDAFVETYPGTLTTAERIVACLHDMEPILVAMDRIWSYSSLALEADYTDNALRERDEKVGSAMVRMQKDLAFVDSEILQAPQEELERAVGLGGDFRTYLTDLLAKRPHMLTPETEKVLAALSRTFDVPYTVYNTMKLADIDFPGFTAGGKDYPLGYSLFEDDYELEADTAVRRAAFQTFSDTLAKYQNTTATAYNAQVTHEKVMAELRGFDSVFDSLLFDQKVTRDMYDRQIDRIMEDLAPHMRKFGFPPSSAMSGTSGDWS